MASEFKVRRARLSDAGDIAQFVNAARSGRASALEVTRSRVTERFGQIGFVVVEHAGELVGLLGWQVENLIVGVTDYLVAPSVADPMAAGRALVSNMEVAALDLRAEVVLLFLPADPRAELVAFWNGLGYEFTCVDDLHRAGREAIAESGLDARNVMSKSLREDAVQRPM